MTYTTTEFLDNVKTLAAIPTSQSTFTVTRLLALGDREMRVGMLPLLKKVRESYKSYDHEYAINATGIYPIPSRAIGASVQDVVLIDAQGHREDVDLITEDQVYGPEQTPVGGPAFYFKGNNIVLAPKQPALGETLLVTFFIRPNKLVEESEAAQITAIDTGTNTLTFASLPSTFTTSTPLDFLDSEPHFDFRAIDQTPDTVTSTTLIFSSLPSTLEVGDWAALAGEAPVVQLPLELHPILEQRVANRCLFSQGHMEQFRTGEKELERLEEEVLKLITPRVQREPKKIVGSGKLIRGRGRSF